MPRWKDTYLYLWKNKLNSKVAPAERVVDSTKRLISAWVLKELSPWYFRQTTSESYRLELKRLYAQHEQLLILKIRKGSATFLGRKGSLQRYAKRIDLYQRLFESVCGSAALSDLDLLLPIVLEDGSLEGAGIPIFCFQKQSSSNCVLLPDIDFMEWDYYVGENLRDAYNYSEKIDCAAFVGSTTGAMINRRNVSDRSVPRLRAAEFFKGSSLVDFRLPSIVQCESEDVIEQLRQKGYGTGTSSWQEQLRNKFLISMDGNGATCSRVVVALRSNSVLLKYRSDSILYYFHGLIPWLHYVPVERDSDVEKIVNMEIKHLGMFENVAAAGAQFANDYLTKSAVETYTALLLAHYAHVVPSGSEFNDEDFAAS